MKISFKKRIACLFILSVSGFCVFFISKTDLFAENALESSDFWILPFNKPVGIVYHNNHLYVVDHSDFSIHKVNISNGTSAVFAGDSGEAGGDDGIGAAARFYFPSGITTDGKYLYVMDNATQCAYVRKIDILTSEVSTIRGDICPTAITYDGENFYIINGCSICRLSIASGKIIRIAGDFDGKDSLFNDPRFLVSDKNYIYVSDTGNHTIQKIDIASGNVTTIAGKAGSQGFADGKGDDARFNKPSGVTIDADNLYVSDTENHIIRKIELKTRKVTTIAGTPGVSGDMDGIRIQSKFNNPIGITSDGKNLYISDSTNHSIRKISISNGEVTTFTRKSKQR